jgi:hypothetical protein
VSHGPFGKKLPVWSADPALNQVRDHLGHEPLGRITAIEASRWEKPSLTPRLHHLAHALE